jgi:hydrogenase-4 component F
VHTWLPDAHAEAPTPVSALLSGALLATSFYAVLRFFQISVATLGPAFPQRVLLVFGVLSLVLAALYLFDQHHVKRMLAYSSIEHMGIIAIGVGFGTPLALAGVLLHVLGHAMAKGAAFMGAGVLVHAFGTKEIRGMRGGIARLPWTGPLFLVAVFALCALPPFAIFRSEFQIILGGFQSSSGVWSGVLVALVTFAFFGLSISTTRILFEPAAGVQPPPHEPNALMTAPILIAVVLLAWIGIHPPASLADLLAAGAAQLGVVR